MTDLEHKNYRYDIAFSFLDKDEGVAHTIAGKLAGRLETFIYTERQAELVGHDGEQKLNRVFGSESRIVGILYRKEWGDTKWTRIEQTAIRNRGMEEGYDFTVFAVLDESKCLPSWVPKRMIWHNYALFGVDGLAASLENRCTERGGTSRIESPSERAVRISRELEKECVRNFV